MLKNRIVCVLFLLFAFISARYIGAGYTLLYSLIMLISASFLITRFASRLTNLGEYIEKTDTYKNEAVYYRTNIQKQGMFIFPRIRCSFFSGEHVRYKEQSPGEYMLYFPYRGQYPVGVSKLFVTDPLGLFTPGFTKKNPILVTVFPKRKDGFVLPLKSELTSGDSPDTDLQAEQSCERFDVRKYAYGDDYRKIHWKLTAKKNELIVKDYNASRLNKTLIFLDTARLNDDTANILEIEDEMTSVVVSAAYFCLQSKLPAVVLFAENTASVQSRFDYDLLLRLMAQVSFKNSEYLHSLLRSYCRTENLYNIVLVIYDLSDELFKTVCELSLIGHNIIIYALKPVSENDFSRESYFAAAGITYNSVYKESKSHELL